MGSSPVTQSFGSLLAEFAGSGPGPPMVSDVPSLMPTTYPERDEPSRPDPRQRDAPGDVEQGMGSHEGGSGRNRSRPMISVAMSAGRPPTSMTSAFSSEPGGSK